MSTSTFLFHLFSVVMLWTVRVGESEKPHLEREHLSLYRRDAQHYENFMYSDLEVAQSIFLSSVQSTLERLVKLQARRTVLVHSRLQNGSDAVSFVKENTVVDTRIIHTPLYYTLKAISHLPVTVVSILLPDALRDEGSVSGDTQSRLVAFNNVLRNISVRGESEQPYYGRNEELVQLVSDFINTTLRNGSITTERLSMFASSVNSHLRANAGEAIREYLMSLNSLIQEVVNSSVVIALHPFAEPGSFLVKFYEAFLNNTDQERIVLQPTLTEEEYCSVDYTGPRNICALSNATLQYRLSEIFNNGSTNTSLHSLLSQTAEDFICSQTNLTLASCSGGNSTDSSNLLLAGFQTRVERGYVILVVLMGATAVMLGIVVLCIYYEDRVMKREKLSAKIEERFRSKYKGPNVFTPVEEVSGGDTEEEEDEVFTESKVNSDSYSELTGNSRTAR